MATTFRGVLVGTVAQRILALGQARREVALLVSPQQQGQTNRIYVANNRAVTSASGIELPLGNVPSIRVDPDTELYAITNTGTQPLGVIVTEPSDLSWEILLRQVIPLIQRSIENQRALIQMLAVLGGARAGAMQQPTAPSVPISMGPMPTRHQPGLVLPEPFWGSWR